MKKIVMDLLFNALRLNPKMKAAPRQTIHHESFKILEAYRHKSDHPDQMGSILDLGGGGEGIIGQVMGRAVTAVDIREDELMEAPDGPFKVVADARALPFDGETFYCATAFYFLMYLKSQDLNAVFNEVFRVLKPSGRFIIWDVAIPEAKRETKRLFVVPLKIDLPNGACNTAYGAPWASRVLNAQQLIRIATEAGFKLEQNLGSDNKIHLVFAKG